MKIKEQNKTYYQKHKKKILAYQKAYQKSDKYKAYHKAYQKLWREADKLVKAKEENNEQKRAI